MISEIVIRKLRREREIESYNNDQSFNTEVENKDLSHEHLQSASAETKEFFLFFLSAHPLLDSLVNRLVSHFGLIYLVFPSTNTHQLQRSPKLPLRYFLENGFCSQKPFFNIKVRSVSRGNAGMGKWYSGIVQEPG